MDGFRDVLGFCLERIRKGYIVSDVFVDIKDIKKGLLCKNTKGEEFVVVEDLNHKKCLIEFTDKHKHVREVHKSAIRSGNVKNPYSITKQGVGYLGYGDYSTDKNKREHLIWSKMLERCYYQGHPHYENYEDVIVCEDWHNFQNFAAWCGTQKGFSNRHFELDKDFLVEGNRVYGPDVCCFLPQVINKFFLKGRTAQKRDKNLAKGVTKMESGNYRAAANGRKLGTFPTQKQAEMAYKNYKKYNLWLLANEYKEELDENVYARLLELSTSRWQDFVIDCKTYQDLISTGMAYEWYPSLPFSWDEAKRILEENEGE